ncbi:type I secretion system permease/ATPase [Blastochloris tepida]|uniref:Peptidase n=1 Tax=Blastochloris tepida TaxID=2233851 RepID=A0A348G235_9HYPH|nr:type I secretion system permease/ATPase [Blastochloris tepida]BBF93618.1 peptidase [Blastochloris tepida]
MKPKLASPTLNALRPLLPAYAGLFALSLFLPFLYFSAPLFVSQIMERVTTSRSELTLFFLAIIALFLLSVHAFLEWVRQKALRRIGADIDQRLGLVLFDAMHRPRPAAGLNASPSTLNDFNIVRDTLSSTSVSAVFDAFWSPLFIIAMALVHWVFGLYALLMVVFSAAMSLLNAALVKNDNERFQRMSGKAAEFGFAVTRNVETVRALGMLPRLRDRWYDLHGRMLGWQQAAARPNDIIAAVVRFVRNAQMVLIYVIGIILFLQQEVSTSVVFIAMIVMLRAMGPIDSLITNWRSYAGFASALSRVDAILKDATQQTNRISLPGLSGPLVVSRVFASAPGGDKPILTDVSFSVAQGRTVGIVGPSGAGKSCLARVLVGVWPPRRGSIAIGDHDLSHWNEDDLGQQMGYMPQDVELLPGTIAENIARFDPKAAEDSSGIIAAAELAGITDLIKLLPEGYNTRVGPGGHVLSGGQRSRIALARAVYGMPSFIVLDEPNSNLDALAEQSLMTMLQKLQAMQSTVLIVTHKLNILNYCDDVLVLNAGTVQAFGTRDQIVDRIPRIRSQPNLMVIEGSAEGRRS